jgi:hypothetical protein
MRDPPWTHEEEEFLARLEKQCNAYYTYFNKDYVYYHKLSSRFNIPILIVSSINALTAISLNDFLGQRYVSIMNAVLSAGTGILGSIQLYMKINEKMSTALRTSVLMKRLALKVSRELSIAVPQRTTEGQSFLQECFSEFNATLEQANPVERRVHNFLEFGASPVPEEKKSNGLMDMVATAVAGMSPRRPSFESLTRPVEPRSKMLWDLLRKGQTVVDSRHGSSTPPNQNGSSPGEESPRAPALEP